MAKQKIIFRIFAILLIEAFLFLNFSQTGALGALCEQQIFASQNLAPQIRLNTETIQQLVANPGQKGLPIERVCLLSGISKFGKPIDIGKGKIVNQKLNVEWDKEKIFQAIINSEIKNGNPQAFKALTPLLLIIADLIKWEEDAVFKEFSTLVNKKLKKLSTDNFERIRIGQRICVLLELFPDSIRAKVIERILSAALQNLEYRLTMAALKASIDGIEHLNLCFGLNFSHPAILNPDTSELKINLLNFLYNDNPFLQEFILTHELKSLKVKIIFEQLRSAGDLSDWAQDNQPLLIELISLLSSVKNDKYLQKIYRGLNKLGAKTYRELLQDLERTKSTMDFKLRQLLSAKLSGLLEQKNNIISYRDSSPLIKELINMLVKNGANFMRGSDLETLSSNIRIGLLLSGKAEVLESIEKNTQDEFFKETAAIFQDYIANTLWPGQIKLIYKFILRKENLRKNLSREQGDDYIETLIAETIAILPQINNQQFLSWKNTVNIGTGRNNTAAGNHSARSSLQDSMPQADTSDKELSEISGKEEVQKDKTSSPQVKRFLNEELIVQAGLFFSAIVGFIAALFYLPIDWNKANQMIFNIEPIKRIVAPRRNQVSEETLKKAPEHPQYTYKYIPPLKQKETTSSVSTADTQEFMALRLDFNHYQPSNSVESKAGSGSKEQIVLEIVKGAGNIPPQPLFFQRLCNHLGENGIFSAKKVLVKGKGTKFICRIKVKIASLKAGQKTGLYLMPGTVVGEIMPTEQMQGKVELMNGFQLKATEDAPEGFVEYDLLENSEYSYISASMPVTAQLEKEIQILETDSGLKEIKDRLDAVRHSSFKAKKETVAAIINEFFIYNKYFESRINLGTGGTYFGWLAYILEYESHARWVCDTASSPDWIMFRYLGVDALFATGVTDNLDADSSVIYSSSEPGHSFILLKNDSEEWEIFNSVQYMDVET
ncbi:MAG: hypothetical protein DRP78_00755, partial [Candidatus Omnitrophota bacterium]